MNNSTHFFTLRPYKRFCLTFILAVSLVLLGACQQSAEPAMPPTSVPAVVEINTQLAPTEKPTVTLEPSATPTITPLPTETATPTELPEDFWQDLPVIPTEISDAMREVYQRGLSMGNDPRIFTKLGDCNSMSPDFLHGFGGLYNLGEYTYLQPVIDYYQHAFRLPNQATNPGTTTSRLLSTLWTGEACMGDELMIDCQFRLDNPSIAIISLGTIDAKYNYLDPAAFERNLRMIIENTLARGIVPVLATKADNLEGDNSINETIARLALEYELPLWNFWRAAQDTVNHGLLPDLEHLNTLTGPPSTDFSVPISMKYGKEIKNFTGLQMLEFLMHELAAPTVNTTQAP
jgi:hypothetical protein